MTPAGASPAAGTQAPEKKFDTPVWHPDVRFIATGLGGGGRGPHGFLDGPSKEVQKGSVGMFGPGYYNFGQLGKVFYGWYDPKTGRAHRVAGNGWGYLDGPFSRARFGNIDYNWNPQWHRDREGRFMLIADRWNRVTNIRYLDFDKQEVRTLMPCPKGFRGITIRADGNFYLLTADRTLRLIDSATGRKLSEQKLTGGTFGYSRKFPLALDEFHNRLYCAQTNSSRKKEIFKWWLWYWDLKDGSFHGVVPRTREKNRRHNTPGPFEGTEFYWECGTISFGPDDPEKRFLYMTRCDTRRIFRLDLEKRLVATLFKEPRKSGKPRLYRFSTTEFNNSRDHVPAYLEHWWLPDGSGIVSKTQKACVLFKRVK